MCVYVCVADTGPQRTRKISQPNECPGVHGLFPLYSQVPAIREWSSIRNFKAISAYSASSSPADIGTVRVLRRRTKRYNLTLTLILTMTPLFLLLQAHHHSRILFLSMSASQERWRVTGSTIWGKRGPPCSQHYRITATKISTYQTGCTMCPGLSL